MLRVYVSIKDNISSDEIEDESSSEETYIY